MYSISLMPEEPGIAENEVSEEMHALNLEEVDEYQDMFQASETPTDIVHKLSTESVEIMMEDENE